MRKLSRPAVATNILVAALRADVRQQTLAEHLGLSQPALSRRLTGEVDFRLGELQAIAGLLEVPLEQLLAPTAAEVPA